LVEDIGDLAAGGSTGLIAIEHQHERRGSAQQL
jgi:hypothetical protein